MITHQKISLFDAPKESYIAHACNAVGVWGSGIAVPFKRDFPHAFAVYNRSCQNNPEALGKAFIIYDNHYRVTCLITSKGYGSGKSSKEDILIYTESSLHSLLTYMKIWDKNTKVVYSNKFNSGLFGVPWEETETVLKRVLDQYHVDWVVCDPNL